MDLLNIVLIAGLLSLAIAFLVQARRKPFGGAPPALGIRREAALERHLSKESEKLLTREVMGKDRRFFLDVERGDRGRYLRISELERRAKSEEQGFTIIVFEHEIPGFYKALRDCVKQMGKEV
jgi:hypothetical protein